MRSKSTTRYSSAGPSHRRIDSTDEWSFIQGLSTRVQLPEKADLIVSEIHGILPPYQRSLFSIMDARDRFLGPGGSLIPRREMLWAALVGHAQAPISSIVGSVGKGRVRDRHVCDPVRSPSTPGAKAESGRPSWSPARNAGPCSTTRFCGPRTVRVDAAWRSATTAQLMASASGSIGKALKRWPSRTRRFPVSDTSSGRRFFPGLSRLVCAAVMRFVSDCVRTQSGRNMSTGGRLSSAASTAEQRPRSISRTFSEP